MSDIAKRIYAYAEKAEDEAGESSNWVAGLNRQYYSVPDDYKKDFIDSIDLISRQLSAAKGEPLTAAYVEELLAWNKGHFDRSVASSLAQYNVAKVSPLAALSAAAAALGVFFLTVLVFVFVKIERNLRGLQLMGTSKNRASLIG